MLCLRLVFYEARLARDFALDCRCRKGFHAVVIYFSAYFSAFLLCQVSAGQSVCRAVVNVMLLLQLGLCCCLKRIDRLLRSLGSIRLSLLRVWPILLFDIIRFVYTTHVARANKIVWNVLAFVHAEVFFAKFYLG